MPIPRSQHSPLVALALVVLVAAMPAVPIGDRASAQELPHSHGGTLLLAVDATHDSQPAHLDASTLRHAWHCSACLGHSRTQGRAALASATLDEPPAAGASSILPVAVALGPQVRRDLSRAPPARA